MALEHVIDERVERSAHAVAKSVARRHIGYVEYEDLKQEAYLWMLTKPERVNKLLDAESPSVLNKALDRVMTKYAMRQRIEKDGTEHGDYFYYTETVVTELLPEALDGADAADSSPSDLNGRIRSGKPANERNDRAAMVADVQVAYSRLDDYDKHLIHSKFSGGGVTDEVLGALTGQPQQTVNYHVHRAIRRMVQALGGAPVEWDEMKGRTAVSNARAIVDTKQQEGGVW